MAAQQEYTMTFDPVTGEACHVNRYEQSEGGVWTGAYIVQARGYAQSLGFRAPDNIRFDLPTTESGLTVPDYYLTQTAVEVWSNTPDISGSGLLYSGPVSGVEAATGWHVAPYYADQFRFGYSLWPLPPASEGGGTEAPLILTNWQFCARATDFSPPPPPPIARVTLDPAKYTLSWREVVGPEPAENPFTRQLGDRVGVWNAELCYEDVPMLVTGLGWHWVAADRPLAETLELTTTVSGMPRTVASGAGAGFILGGGLGLGYGKLG